MLAGARNGRVCERGVELRRFADQRGTFRKLALHLLGLVVLKRHLDQRARVTLGQSFQLMFLPSTPRNAWNILECVSGVIRELIKAPARSTAIEAANARNSCCAARSAPPSSAPAA